MAKTNVAGAAIKIVAVNKKARFNFEFLEKFEAGIVLTGGEIKSVRGGGISIAESYIRPEKGELILIGATIKPYVFTHDKNYEQTRPRKLLLHKHEIEKLTGKVEAKGLTLIPLSIYLKDGRAKVEVALAKGKASPDKRQNIKDRESERELLRHIKSKK